MSGKRTHEASTRRPDHPTTVPRTSGVSWTRKARAAAGADGESAPSRESEAARINSRVLRSPASWVLEHFGRDTLEAISETAGLRVDDLTHGSHWVDMGSADGFLHEVQALAETEDRYREACSHRMREGYGPMILMLHAATPLLILKIAAKTMHLMAPASKCVVVADERTRIMVRYTSTAPQHESRAMCISRQATSAAIPTLFGLPAAVLTESACIANGDDCCEYEVRFYTRTRWFPALTAAIGGGIIAYAFSRAGLSTESSWFAIPLACALLGVVYELRRTFRANLARGEEIQVALRELAEQEADAHREILQLHHRQKEWGRLLEEQVGDRTQQLQDLIERIEVMSAERVTSVRGVSHDLRNPLALLRLNTGYLMGKLSPDDPDLQQVLADNQNSIDEMDRLLVELVASAKADANWIRVTPAELTVAPLVDQLRRRVRALSFGKDIRVSVIKHREAPAVIETDLLIFERIVDNICSNAAKYTESGSVVIDIEGKPGFLTLKVSDTGSGIEEERIRQIFEPDGTGADHRAPRSLGMGLSVVVQLMAELGGKLEVMSQPGRGTTLWAHFPIELPKSERAVDGPATPVQLADVVTIRPSNTG